MSKRGTQRHEIRISLLTGGLIAMMIVIAGGIAALAQKTAYTAESVIVLLPNADLDTAASAAYYETLSRGQIVATFAEVANNLRFEQQAEEKLLLTDEQRATTTTVVSVVPNTSVILVRATSEDSTTAEQIADGSTSLATEYLGSLSKPYRTSLVKGADGSAYLSSTSPVLVFGLAVVVALIAGLAFQQASYHLLTAFSRGPKRSAATPRDTPEDASTEVDSGAPVANKHVSILR